MEIHFLGTSPGLPLPDRFGQTTILTTRGENDRLSHYLLDVADGASSLLARGGFNHLDIRAIAISHMHADHHGGLAQVLKTSMHLNRRDELVILAPEEGISALRAYLEASYLYPEWLGYPIRWESFAAVASGDSIELPGSLKLQAFANNHLGSARDRFAALGVIDHGRSFESYSMAIEDGTSRVVYSGNLLGPRGADEMASFVEPADLLICELAHVDPEELGRFLAGRRIARTVLAHISPKWQGVPDEDVLALVRSGAAGQLLGEVEMARDGQSFLAVASAAEQIAAGR